MNNFYKKILCKCGLHKWKNISVIKISSLIKLLINTKFKNKGYKYPKINNDFYLKKRKCENCGLIDDDIYAAKVFLTETMEKINEK